MKRILGILLTWLVALTLVSAQNQSETYRLQPEDVLRIQVFGLQEIAAEVPVGKDGAISAPYLGQMKAGGLTVVELEANLTAEYKRKLRLREPRVSVLIVRFRQAIATVGPAVNRPGPVSIRPGDTVLDLLNGASGTLLNNQSDLRRATLRKRGSIELIPIDLYAMLILGDLSQNYPVEDGDELNVPENRNNRVYVLGAVPRPGPVLYRDGMTVSEILIEAGGDIQYRTQLSKTVVKRQKPGLPGEFDTINVDLIKFFSKNDSGQNIQLRAGDIVYFSDTKTPDANRIAQLSTSVANFFFILDRFGINIIGR